MEIALNDGDLKRFIDHITSQFNIEDHPILIDKYLAGKECEVDAICDDEGIDSRDHGTRRKSWCPLW